VRQIDTSTSRWRRPSKQIDGVGENATWRCSAGLPALPAGGGQTQEELKKKLRHTSQLEEVEARALVEEAKVAIYVAKPLGFDSFSCNTVPR